MTAPRLRAIARENAATKPARKHSPRDPRGAAVRRAGEAIDAQEAAAVRAAQTPTIPDSPRVLGVRVLAAGLPMRCEHNVGTRGACPNTVGAVLVMAVPMATRTTAVIRMVCTSHGQVARRQQMAQR